MKLTKILSISAILLAGLMLTGCQNEPGSGGTSGNNPTGIKAKDVIRVSNNGKTVEINYTNNTDEEQKFLLFAGKTFGYDFGGRYYIYNPEGDKEYKFGMIYDYSINNYDPDCCYCINLELDSLNSTEDLPRIQTIAAAGEFLVKNFNNLDFSEIISYHGNKDGPSNMELNDGKNDYIYFNLVTDSDKIKINGNYFPELKKITPANDDSQYGYYLIIKSGSTCHLKLNLKDNIIK